MSNLRDRVKCATATTGTGTITLGATSAGFRSFGSAFAADAVVSYAIEDGTAWETGYGTYSVANNTLTRAPVASSSAGAAITLSGSATVAVVFLSADYSGDWPVLVVSNASSQSVNTTGFVTLAMPTVAINTHGGWDGSLWTVPAGQSGLYDIISKVRYADSQATGISYGQGVGTSNVDGPSFIWTTTVTVTSGQTQRNGLLNNRTMMLNAGDQLRLFTFHQFGAAAPVSGCEMIVKRVR